MSSVPDNDTRNITDDALLQALGEIQPELAQVLNNVNIEANNIQSLRHTYQDNIHSVRPGNYHEIEYRKLLSMLPKDTVKNIGIDLLSTEEKENLASGRLVSSPEKGIAHGMVNSINMGNRGYDMQICSTCENKECMGHFGLIRLPIRMISPLFIAQVVNIIQISCYNCGAFCVSQRNHKVRSGTYTKASLRELCQKYIGNCPGCNREKLPGVDMIHIKYKESCAHNVILYSHYNAVETSRGVKYVLQPEINMMNIDLIQKYLVNAARFTPTNKDQKSAMKMLGYSVNIENMIISSIPVMPPRYRSSSTINGIDSDMLGKIYSRIVKSVQSISTERGGNIKLQLALIQNVAALYKKADSSSRDIKALYSPSEYVLPEEILVPHYNPSKIDKEHKSIPSMLAGKEGAFKSSFAWRALNTARFILAPDPLLPYDVIELPRICGTTLTVNVKVTADNIAALRKLKKKTNEHPRGKIYQIWKYGNNAPTTNINTDIDVGDTIARYLMEDDIIVYERYPIIYIRSISIARVKFSSIDSTNKNSCKLSVRNAEGMHADHDGDTLVIRAIVNGEATSSACYYMNPANSYISCNDGKYLGGLIMESLAGSIKMSEMYLDTMSREDFSYYLLSYLPEDKVNDKIESLEKRLNTIKKLKPEYNELPLFTPRMLLSSVLPDDFYVSTGKINIVMGIIMSNLTKNHFGNSTTSIAIYLTQQYDAEFASRCFDNASWLCYRWIDYYGLTYSPRDIYHHNFRIPIESAINKEYEELHDEMFLHMYRSRIAGLDRMDAESHSINMSGKIQSKAYQVIKNNMPEDLHSLNLLIKTGKLTEGIIVQILAVVGQGVFLGKLVDRLCNNGRRVTTADPVRNTGSVLPPEETAFVKGSYALGLRAKDCEKLGITSMGASISTNCSTASTGHSFNLTSSTTGSMMTENGMITTTNSQLSSLTVNKTGIDNTKCGAKMDIVSFTDKLSWEYLQNTN